MERFLFHHLNKDGTPFRAETKRIDDVAKEKDSKRDMGKAVCMNSVMSRNSKNISQKENAHCRTSYFPNKLKWKNM